MMKKLLAIICLIFGFNSIYSQTYWELLNPKPTINTGKDIDFVSATIGYIITGTELLETLDAGTTWQKKQNISSANDMSFYNGIGFIVGNDGYVLRSDNNGNTWTSVYTGFLASFNTVNIIDQNTIVFSTSNSIVRSSDGGATWQNLDIPITFVFNEFVVGSFFSSELVGHVVFNSGKILKTIDGGQNWYVTKMGASGHSTFFKIHFASANVGFATSGSNTIYKTSNGGETWSLISSPYVAIYDIHFLNENIGFITGQDGATLKTTDGGTTWQPIPFQSGYIDQTSMFGIYFQTNNIGYATGMHGRIIKTTDGGTTWVEFSAYQNVNQIQFLDDSKGYARSNAKFFKTIDNGNNWIYQGSANLFDTSVPSGPSTFVTENIGYATTSGSYGGHVLKTTNGGISWTVLNNGVDIIDEGISSICFIDENTGFISGGFNQRRIMKTTNGGASWSQVGNVSLGDIQFVSSLVGYGHRIGNSNGRIYKTIDGGNTWNVSIEVNKDIKAFHFTNENNGYFAGNTGLFYKTTDGGTTWTIVKAPNENYVFVKFHTSNVGYARGDSGRLYRTQNSGYSWDLLTTIAGISDLELNGNNIFLSGADGKILRSNIVFSPVYIIADAAQNISATTAVLSGNVASNSVVISDIAFLYSTDLSLSNAVTVTSGPVAMGESLSVSANLSNLTPNTTYYYTLRGGSDSNYYYSQIKQFTTLQEYEITTNFSFDFTSATASISGKIISNANEITNIEFQYGISQDALNNILTGSPDHVAANTTITSSANLTNLEPQTQYFYRIKATQQGQEIYGNIMSFITNSAYEINVYSPTVNQNTVTLSAFVTTYDYDFTDIVFEYGTSNFENIVSTTPSQISANNWKTVSVSIPNLNPNLNYYYRLKATYNGQTVYSHQRLFNLLGNIIMVSGSTGQTENGSLTFKGLVNAYGNYLTDVHFEYGLTDSFGSSVDGSPNLVYGYNTNTVTSTITDVAPNQTYYYRLAATRDDSAVYSGTFQFTTGILGTDEILSDKRLLIYPNPATDYFNVGLKVNETITSIELYTLQGSLIYSENVVSGTTLAKISTSRFAKGLYFIKVNLENNKSISSKVLLN